MDFGWAPIRPISKAVLFTLTKMHEIYTKLRLHIGSFFFLIKIIRFSSNKESLVNNRNAKNPARAFGNQRKV